jgi:serine phosphatase RsbU (regulator of sigma subunit)/pSer/pThr/pTyr-binding forkhead associated (FHA) protein
MDLWLSGEHHGKRIYHGLTGECVTIGRGTDNDLVLPSQTVSRHHAKVSRQEDSIVVTDLGSLNGTRVNGQAVEAERKAVAGDVIEFGSVVLRLTDGEDTATPIWKDEKDLSQSILLSREETAEASLAGPEPGLLELLTEAGQLLVLPGEPEETFDRLLELVEKQIPANRILILMSEEGQEPMQRAARVHGDRAISPLMLSRTMVRMVVHDGASVLTGDAQADERFRHQQSIVAQDLHSAMAVPLSYHDEILGVLYVDTNDPVASYTEHDLRVLTLLGQMLGAKIANARLLEVAREQERLKEELRAATTIQKRLLPQQLPEIPGYEIVGSQETCEAVGGDLYDAGRLEDGRFQIVLGDVSGKGIGAALLMSDVLATIRALRAVEIELNDLVARLDRHLIVSTQPEHYVTLFMAVLDPGRNHLDFVNAGHPPAYLLVPGQDPRALNSSGVPVGLVDLPGIEFRKEDIEFPPGSTLVIYSDGVSEAERGDELFGDERLLTILKECRGLTAEDCARTIESAVDSYLGSTQASDDTTILVLHRAE